MTKDEVKLVDQWKKDWSYGPQVAYIATNGNAVVWNSAYDRMSDLVTKNIETACPALRLCHYRGKISTEEYVKAVREITGNSITPASVSL